MSLPSKITFPSKRPYLSNLLYSTITSLPKMSRDKFCFDTVTERLPQLRDVDPCEPDTVLSFAYVQDGDGIAVRNSNNPSFERFGTRVPRRY